MKRYYINLFATNPCVTFTHPHDTAANGAQAAVAPALKSANSSGSSTSLQKVQSRLGIRPAGSREPVGVSSNTSASISSGRQRQKNAQQLYSSSLTQVSKATASPPLSRPPSLSSMYTGSADSVSDEAIAADRPSVIPSQPDPPAPNIISYGQRAATNPTVAISPSPLSIHSPLASHGHSDFFDNTRLSHVARNGTSQAPLSGPSRSQAFASLAPASSPSVHTLPSNIVRRSTTQKYHVPANSTGRWNGSDKLALDVSELYPSHAGLLSPRSSQTSGNVPRLPTVHLPSDNNNITTSNHDRQTPHHSNQNFSNSSISRTATTEEKGLNPMKMIAPSNGASAISDTEDGLFGVSISPQTEAPTKAIVPEIQSASGFYTQKWDLSEAFQTQANLGRRQTISYVPVAEQQPENQSLSLTQTDDLALHQPQPLRPLRASPANMNEQVQASQDAFSDAGSNGKRKLSRRRKSFRLSIFGLRTKEVS